MVRSSKKATLLDLEAQPRYGPYDQVQWQFELNLSQKFNILFHV